ncbi:MAG TPA: cobyrinic acid a,c-diamide synthase, partial [Gammaproteobacteria bacterium]|nr:cobyrinic acid a,c-diamide synthase [Gammaproteobacteria bacterium]
MSHIMLSAAHKSSGKTTISIGVCAALCKRQLRVQPFKKGPDYIDPLWLGRAAGHDCINLDFYTMQQDEITARFYEHMAAADIGVIEGNKGLYDGLDLDGTNSNAALAKQLGANVILVLDARGMTRGIAPLVLGYQNFDPAISITGVILNQVGGSRHEGKLVSILEHYTDVKLLGAVHRNPELIIDERHLGLVPSNETGAAQRKIDTIRRAIEDQVDLDALIEHAGRSTLPAPAPAPEIQNTIIRT